MNERYILVGGLAQKATNVLPLRILGDIMSSGMPVHAIDGAHDINGELTARTPSSQTHEIEKIASEIPDSRITLLAMSAGAVAASSALNGSYGSRIRAITISPPLASPAELLRYPQISSRLQCNTAGQVTVGSLSFAEGHHAPGYTPPNPANVIISPQYFEEIDAATNTFYENMMQAAVNGQLNIVSPRGDWNTAGVEMASSFPGTITVDGTHTLYASPEKINETCRIIADAANYN